MNGAGHDHRTASTEPWAHDETRKSFGIAGADVVDAPAFSLPIEALGGKPPRESDDVVASLDDMLTKLAAEAG
jgi:hypothetical protein